MKKLNYKISSKITPDDLMKYGFHRIYPSSYVYRVPCYKHNKQPLIFLEFLVGFEVNSKKEFENPTMLINCKDKNDNFYVPFYREDYFNKNEVLDKINRKLSLVISDMIKKELIVKKNKTNSKRRRK